MKGDHPQRRLEERKRQTAREAPGLTEIARGSVLHLAIYAEPGEPPIAVRARVTRNEGPAGVALRFEQIGPGAARRIEALVARLPSVEPLQQGECGGLGSVVSRVLEEPD